MIEFVLCVCLGPCLPPPIPGDLFPLGGADHQSAMVLWRQSKDHLCFLRERAEWDVVTQGHLEAQEFSEKAWDLLTYATSFRQGMEAGDGREEAVVEYLMRLRDHLGAESYYSGRMPSPIVTKAPY